MSKHKGFTFVEISLFLVVTALIFIGIAGAMQNTIFQQKYNDSVQNFLEFLRDIYSEVSNPQSTGFGNSNQAIYGKLVVFGESMDLLGGEIDGDEHPVFVYDVIGRDDTSVSSRSALDLLKSLDADVIIYKDNEPMLASPERYSPRWGAVIEDTNKSPMEKSILIVRHPDSGTLNTFVYDKAIQVNEIFGKRKDACSSVSLSEQKKCKIKILFSDDPGIEFGMDEVNFCINSEELSRSLFSSPQNIRIIKNARNASGVLKIEIDGDKNKCKM